MYRWLFGFADLKRCLFFFSSFFATYGPILAAEGIAVKGEDGRGLSFSILDIIRFFVFCTFFRAFVWSSHYLSSLYSKTSMGAALRHETSSRQAWAMQYICLNGKSATRCLASQGMN